MSDEASNLHEQAIVVVGHSDIVASDVDWRRESGERGVLDRRHLPTLRAGGVTVICDHVGGDAPYGYLPATRLSTSYLQRFMRALDHTHAEIAENPRISSSRARPLISTAPSARERLPS